MRFTRCAATLSLLLAVALLSSCASKGPVTEQQASVRIACLGDSITSGFKLADPAHKSYPAQLSQQSHGQHWYVLNLGVNGATVINKGDIPVTAQKPYQRLMRSDPDIVVIMLGTNDIKDNNWRFIEDFIDNYAVMIKNIQTLPSTPRVIVCSIPPIFTDYPNGLNAKRQKEINVLVQKTADIAGVEFFDINALLQQKSSLFVDGIHPNIAGAQEIATLVFKKVSTVLDR